MPADLKQPFAESCCDGGQSGLDDRSAQVCGCDKSAGWVCERHRELKQILQDGRDAVARVSQHAEDEMNREILHENLMRDTVPAYEILRAGGGVGVKWNPVQTPLLGWTERRLVQAGLPTTDTARKGLPIFTGLLMYFPLALAAVSEVSRVGNEQHNPGEPLHWAREKSTDQLNTAMRHLMDHGMGVTRDTDGTWHLAKAIWRLCAELQLEIERTTKTP